MVPNFIQFYLILALVGHLDRVVFLAVGFSVV